MSARTHSICRGEALSPEKQAAYRESWARLAGERAKTEPAKPALRVVKVYGKQPPRTPIHPGGPCIHRGPAIRTETCQFCGRRGKLEPVYSCSVWGECSVRPYRASQPSQDCRSCDQYQPSVIAPTTSTDPAGPPFGIPIPANCTPIPAGQTVFNGQQWKRLSDAERAYYRALRRAREAAAELLPPVPLAEPAPAATITPQTPSRDRTPFYTPDDKPLWLSHLGQGASCFIVLGGPSLNSLNLSELSRRGIFTIGVNNSPTLVRTNAWTFVDTPSKFHDGIWMDAGCLKFVNRKFLHRSVRTRGADGKFGDLKGSDGKPLLIRDMPGVIGVERNADFEPSRWLSEPSINWGQSKKSSRRAREKYPQTLNCMFAVVKLAYALGFRVVYLLGCDFQMTEEQPYAFAQAKPAGAVRSNNGTYQKLSKMFALLAPHFDAAGFHVFNCNPDSGLTVFPFCPFDRAIATATSRVPQGVLRADGWYAGFAGE